MVATSSAPKATGRVKTNFGDSVAHEWTKQVHEYGANGPKSNHNFYFRGATIYSYGQHFPIATILPRRKGEPQTVIFTTRGYSITINAHIWATKRAIPSDWRVIYCENIFPATKETHERNIKDMLLTLEGLADKQKHARSNDYRPEINRLVLNLDSYCHVFKLRRSKRVQSIIDKVGEPELWAGLCNISTVEGAAMDARKREAQRERAKRLAAEEERQVKCAEGMLPTALEVYHAGGDKFRWALQQAEHSVYEVFSRLGYTALRLTGDREEVATSEDAFISVETARRIWPLLKARQAPEEIQGYRTIGFKDGVLIVGCHRIPFAELAYIAGQLGLAV